MNLINIIVVEQNVTCVFRYISTFFRRLFVGTHATGDTASLEQIPLHLITCINCGSLYPRKDTRTSLFMPGKLTFTAVCTKRQG